jgi:hypothetical protein
MTFTLWRDTHLLGEIHLLPQMLEVSPTDQSSPSELAGILLPAEDVGRLTPLMQTTVAWPSGTRVFQTPVAVVYAKDRADGAHVRLSRMSPEEVERVLPEQLLHIRSAAGAAMRTGTLVLSEYCVEYKALLRAMPDVPIAAWHRGSLWYVMARFEAEPSAM